MSFRRNILDSTKDQTAAIASLVDAVSTNTDSISALHDSMRSIISILTLQTERIQRLEQAMKDGAAQ